MELINPEWFRELLKARGQTPASFARTVGVTPATLHRLCNGTRRASPALAYRIAVELEVGWTSLFKVAAA